MDQATGVFKWYDERVERGVIRRNSDKKEFYVYRSNIISGVPTKGARVIFEWEPSKVVREGFLPKAHKIIIQERQMRVQLPDCSAGMDALAMGLPSSEVFDDGQ